MNAINGIILSIWDKKLSGNSIIIFVNIFNPLLRSLVSVFVKNGLNLKNKIFTKYLFIKINR
jgi:hypothetical protein